MTEYHPSLADHGREDQTVLQKKKQWNDITHYYPETVRLIGARILLLRTMALTREAMLSQDRREPETLALFSLMEVAMSRVISHFRPMVFITPLWRPSK